MILCENKNKKKICQNIPLYQINTQRPYFVVVSRSCPNDLVHPSFLIERRRNNESKIIRRRRRRRRSKQQQHIQQKPSIQYSQYNRECE